MASTIRLAVELKLDTANGTSRLAPSALSITQVGAQKIANVQIVGTTTEALVLGDVTTIGYLALTNLDATNFVQIGLATPVDASNAFCKLLPGESALIPTRQTTIYALADTASVNLDVLAIEL